MNKTIILFFLLSIFTCWGRNDWYDEPLEIDTGYTIIDSLSSNIERAQIHVRLQRKNKKATSWELQWNKINDTIYNTAIVILPDLRAFDDIYVPNGKVDVFKVTGKEKELLLSSTFPVDDMTSSLQLIYDGVSARMYAGTKERTLIGIVPFDANIGREIAISLESPMNAIRLTAEAQCYPESLYLPSESLLTGDKFNPIEGHWKYLDRDINQSMASMGGKYNLLIVPSGDNTFDIVITDGANINKEEWNNLRIKGKLKSSGFQGNYDLQWYDAMGRLLDDDNNAQISEDGSVLTLFFPVYKSQLRFKRVK